MTTRYVRAAQHVRIQQQERRARAVSILDSIPSVLVYPVLLVFLIYPYGDYDWGWHYRYGEYFWTHGRILRHDIYSWTMYGYEWVNHSWLYDPILSLLYTRVSFWGLSVAAGAIGLTVFYIGIRRAQLPFLQTGILALCFAWLAREALLQGLRTQVISLLLFAVLMELLVRGRDEAWCYWTLPGLFLVWANIHGSFPLGLAIFAIFVVCDFVLPYPGSATARQRSLLLPASFVISAAATLLNPFTYRVYLEAIRHFSNPLLPKVIEWRPPDYNGILGVVAAVYTVVLGWSFYARGRKRFDPAFAAVTLLTFALALTARRHGPVFMVVTLPLAAVMLKHVRFRVVGVKTTGLVLALIIAIVGVALHAKLPEYRLLRQSSFGAYCGWLSCPEELVTFLVRNPPKGRGFNFYDWGGYFIGRGVDAKLFIDGRMHLWERDGYHPMADYDLMYYADNVERFQLYRFDWVVVPRDSKLAKRLFTEPAVWKAAYADRVGVYFVRAQ